MARPKAKRNRRQIKPRQQWVPPVLIVEEMAILGPNIIGLEPSVPMTGGGVPDWTLYTDGAMLPVSPVSAVITNDPYPQIEVTFDGAVGTATRVRINKFDDAIRTSAGGYISPGWARVFTP